MNGRPCLCGKYVDVHPGDGCKAPDLYAAAVALKADMAKLEQAARRVVMSRSDEIQTDSINWTVVLECRLDELAGVLGIPVPE